MLPSREGIRPESLGASVAWDGVKYVIDIHSDGTSKKPTGSEQQAPQVGGYMTNQLKYATQKRVLREVTLIKLCKPQMESTKDSLLDRIRALEKQVEEGSFAVAQPQERVVYVNGEAPKPQPKPQLPKALKEDVKQVTSNFRKIANEASGMLRGYLKQARLSVDNQDRLLIVLPDEISASVVGSEEHKQELKDLIEKKIGKTVEIDVRQVENGRHFEDSFVDIEKVINMEITIEDE